jgi:hypothetical protein
VGTKWSGTTSRCWAGASVSRVASVGAHLSDDLAGLRVPAEGAVVLAARQEQVCILFAPGY